MQGFIFVPSAFTAKHYETVILVTCGFDGDCVDAPLINVGGTWHVCPYRHFIHVGNHWGLKFMKVWIMDFISKFQSYGQSYGFYFKSCGTDSPMVILLILKLCGFRKLLSQPRDAANSVKLFSSAIFLAQTVINLLEMWCCCSRSLAIFSIKSSSIVDRHGFIPTPSSQNFFEAHDCLTCRFHSISHSFVPIGAQVIHQLWTFLLFLGSNDFLQTLWNPFSTPDNIARLLLIVIQYFSNDMVQLVHLGVFKQRYEKTPEC